MKAMRPYLSVAILTLMAQALFAQPPSWDTIVDYAVRSGESTWRKVQNRDESLGSREIYRYALALCEANTHLDRLYTLFDVGAQMQERDPESRGYGNFYWYWRENTVRDYNGVEFCMQSGALIWLRHRDKLPEPARKLFRETLDYAVQGCLRHGVRESYSNIALMNAGNLILLGESLDMADVADEGYRRLERAALFTYRYGTHEYVSPTYYGVDIECLSFIARFAQRKQGRNLARAMLELFWTDVALNWFAPSETLAGAQSRTYDYLRGLGHLDVGLWVEGWIAGSPRGGTNALYQALSTDHPDENIRALSDVYPRLIRQRWDVGLNASRTHYVLPDVTLSAAGANYGAMDMPLTVDFPGSRTAVRLYFIPDARHDPYGKKKIPAGNHQKAQHLKPFWRAAQRTENALGIVRYRAADLTGSYQTLESHIVMPQSVDEFWIGNQRFGIAPASSATYDIPSGQALIIRKGTALVGMRIPWATKQNGQPASAQLIYDGNAYGAMRLTVSHRTPGAVRESGAAFWIRVGSNLKTDEAIAAWRRQFTAAAVSVTESAGQFSITVPGKGGPVGISQPLTGTVGTKVTPPFPDVVLEYDGVDIGRQILNRVDWLSERLEASASVPIPIPGIKRAYWEAEAGAITPPVISATDPNASNGAYAWMPGPVGGKGGSALGAITWHLQLPDAGRYYLWARLLAPTPDDDSFYVRVYTPEEERVPQSEWHTGQHKTWEWAPIKLNLTSTPTVFHLPKGDVFLEFRVREDGTKIDRLYLTPNADDEPTDLPSGTRGSSDFNHDGQTDFSDFLLFAQGYGTRQGMANYSGALDLDSSGTIDFSDFILFAATFGDLA